MKRISLNENWQFARFPDWDGVGAVPSAEWENVTLPHCNYTDEEPYHGLMLYRRTVSAQPGWRKVFLEFDGADQVCRVSVNGIALGEHRGGYSRFRFEVPEEALQEGELRVEVCLDNRLNPAVSPTFGDFTVFGGLYRGVNLILTGEDHFDYCYYGTNGVIARASVAKDGSGLLDIEPHVCTGDAGARIEYTLYGPDGSVAAACTCPAGEAVRLKVERPALWNGKTAVSFYRLRAALLANGAQADVTELRLGFRCIEMDAREGLRLNGVRTKLCGVAKHQDRADVFSAVTPEMIDADFDLIREIGANAVRLSHYQHPQRAYDRADEDGLLVWAEIPMLKMTEDAALQVNALEQLRELILQNIHHPSIFCWGIQNEIGMFRDAPYMHVRCRELAALARALDPTRLVAAANLYNVKFQSELNAISDIVGYNLYFGWYYGEMHDYGKFLDALHTARPQTPFGISEYGVDANPALHAENPACRDYSEEYQALWHETVHPIIRGKDYLWGSFVWNMFDFSSDRRDEGGVKGRNCKGLVSYDRTLRKDAFYYYKAAWSDDPFLHICSRRFVRRAQEAVDVKVYTNQPDVTLYVGGALIGTAKNNGNGTVLFPAVAQCQVKMWSGPSRANWKTAAASNASPKKKRVTVWPAVRPARCATGF